MKNKKKKVILPKLGDIAFYSPYLIGIVKQIDPNPFDTITLMYKHKNNFYYDYVSFKDYKIVTLEEAFEIVRTVEFYSGQITGTEFFANIKNGELNLASLLTHESEAIRLFAKKNLNNQELNKEFNNY